MQTIFMSITHQYRIDKTAGITTTTIDHEKINQCCHWKL